MKKYKVSGRAEDFNNGKWLYVGRKTLEEIEVLKITKIFTQYRLIDLDTKEEIIIDVNK